MAKSRSPAFRALVTLGAQLLSGGIWAVIAPASLAKAAPYLIIVGLFIVAIAYFWDELRDYYLWKRGPRHLYVSWIRERLPGRGPDSHFHVYRIHRTSDHQVIWGYSEHTGEISGEANKERPYCEHVKVTNHSDVTLVNIGLRVSLEPMPEQPGGARPETREMTVEFQQVRPGDHGTAFIVNETPLVVQGRVTAATGTPVGGTPGPLNFHQNTFGLMVFYPRPTS